jgi:hypothetical protein
MPRDAPRAITTGPLAVMYMFIHAPYGDLYVYMCPL